jgi:hypothetical protein
MKAFIYEPDYIFLVKLFFENVKETPRAVRLEKLPDPYWDTDVFLLT